MINWIATNFNEWRMWAISAIGTITGTTAEAQEKIVYAAHQTDQLLKVLQYCSFFVAILSGILATIVSYKKLKKK